MAFLGRGFDSRRLHHATCRESLSGLRGTLKFFRPESGSVNDLIVGPCSEHTCISSPLRYHLTGNCAATATPLLDTALDPTQTFQSPSSEPSESSFDASPCRNGAFCQSSTSRAQVTPLTLSSRASSSPSQTPQKSGSLDRGC